AVHRHGHVARGRAEQARPLLSERFGRLRRGTPRGYGPEGIQRARDEARVRGKRRRIGRSRGGESVVLFVIHKTSPPHARGGCCLLMGILLPTNWDFRPPGRLPPDTNTSFYCDTY